MSEKVIPTNFCFRNFGLNPWKRLIEEYKDKYDEAVTHDNKQIVR